MSDAALIVAAKLGASAAVAVIAKGVVAATHNSIPWWLAIIIGLALGFGGKAGIDFVADLID